MKLSAGSVLLACAFGTFALPLTQDVHDSTLEAREISGSPDEQLLSREYEEALAAHYARFSIEDELDERQLLGQDEAELDARSDLDEFDLEVRSELDELEELIARDLEPLDARELEAFSELSSLERRALLRKLVGPARRVISAIRPGAGKRGVSLPRSSANPKKPSASPAKRSGGSKKPAKSKKGGSVAKGKNSKPSKKTTASAKNGKGKKRDAKRSEKKRDGKKSDGKKSDGKKSDKKKRQGKGDKGSGKGKGKGGKGEKPKKRAIRNLNLNIDPASIVTAGATVATAANALFG